MSVSAVRLKDTNQKRKSNNARLDPNSALCRDDVKVIIQRALKESLGKHMKDTLPIFNIPTQELKKFLDFTYDYHIM